MVEAILQPHQVSAQLSSLITETTRRLVDGATPQHRILLRQLDLAQIAQVALTGTGLFAVFHVEETAERVSPPDLIGGDVQFQLEGLRYGAGSLVKITNGLLDLLDIHLIGDESWPSEPRLRGFTHVFPVDIPASATM